MENNTIKIKKLASRINKTTIEVFDENPLTGAIIHKLTIESEKLTKKAIYSQMTTEELKGIQKIITELLKERENTNGK